MPDTAIVAAAQPRWKRHTSDQELYNDLTRFTRLAVDKGADLLLFPEMTGLLVVGPLAEEVRQNSGKQGGLFGRLVGSIGGSPQISEVLPTLITRHREELTERYTALFGSLASEAGMVVLGGSLLVEGDDGSIQYRAGVFDRNGALLGWQPKLHLTEDEARVAQPGEALSVFEADFGRFGVLVGNDILFPELARALAYRGCVGILNPTLARSEDGWRRQHLVARARAQENQLFVAQSFLVGVTDLFPGESDPYSGRSAVVVPVELSPRRDGIMGMVGAEKVEGLVTGEWNVAALRNLWATTEFPVRSLMRGELFSELLAFDYQSGATISERTADLEEVPPLIPDRAEAEYDEPVDEEAALPDRLPLPPTLEEPSASDLLPPESPPDGAEIVPPASDEAYPEGDTGDDSLRTATRTIPRIDPETGYYLGEQPETEAVENAGPEEAPAESTHEAPDQTPQE